MPADQEYVNQTETFMAYNILRDVSRLYAAGAGVVAERAELPTASCGRSTD
jgi:hypothetical protein